MIFKKVKNIPHYDSKHYSKKNDEIFRIRWPKGTLFRCREATNTKNPYFFKAIFEPIFVG